VSDPERHVARPDPERRARLNQRLRQAFIEGAEELERVLRRYPGDVGERRQP
jgi:hypothetical protein